MTPRAARRDPRGRARSLPAQQETVAAALAPSGMDEALREERTPARAMVGGIRRHAARGTIINAAFQIGLAGLMLLRRLIVAIFLTASEFGLWGLLLTAVLAIVFIKNAGISDRFVQQAEPDQQSAFQKAFTIDLLLSVIATALALVALPIFALAYGRGEIILPGAVLCLAIIGNSLQSPTWIYYRQMDFVRQRTIQAVDPCVAFVVTVGLAVAGAGYWSLVVGGVVGSFAGAAVALWSCPYPIRLRLGKGTIRDYFSFSWPLVVASGGGIGIGLVTMVIASRTLGLAAVGAIGLAGAVTAFSDGVDGIVTRTLYPAICAVRDRAELLFEAFIKTNRLALMWGLPFGMSVALFAADLVNFVVGSRWEPAIVVLQALGVVAGLDQLGFNWAAFLRAVNRTRPIAALAALNVAAFAFITAPALVVFGLPGFAAGVVGAHVITLIGRAYVLKRLFAEFRVLRYVGRAVAPVLPAVGIVLAARLLANGERSAELAIVEVVVFWATTFLATSLLERALIGEMFGYLARRTPRVATGSTA